MAVLAPVPKVRKRDPEEVISDDIGAFGERHSLGNLRLKGLIEEGR